MTDLSNSVDQIICHCLPIFQQFLDTSAGSKVDLFKVKEEYGKELVCPDI